MRTTVVAMDCGRRGWSGLCGGNKRRRVPNAMGLGVAILMVVLFSLATDLQSA